MPRLSYIWVLIPLLFPALSFAAAPPDINSVDQIIQAYETATRNWEPIIHNLTLSLFWGLVTISFTWSSIQIALKDGGLVDVMADLVTRVMTVGVSVWLLNEAPNLARSLIESFQHIGNQLSGGDVKFSPGNIIELSINIISIIFDNASVWKPVSTLMLFLVALIILICFALIAKDMTILIISAYITVSGGIAMMGFLGSEWTREHAINYFTAVLGVALKMFVMQLLISLGYGFIRDWCAGMSDNSDTVSYLLLAGVSIIFYGMVNEVPQIAASLASGRFTQGSGGGAIGAMVAGAASVAAGAAIAGAGIGGDAIDAYKAASGAGGSDDDSMKRGMNTGPSNPGSPVSSPASSTASDSESSSPQRANSDNPSPLKAGMKAAASSLGKATKSAAGGAVRSLANNTVIGRAMAQAGIDPKTEKFTPEQSQQLHQIMMQNLNKPPASRPAPSAKPAASTADDGNDINNYRDTLNEEHHKH